MLELARWAAWDTFLAVVPVALAVALARLARADYRQPRPWRRAALVPLTAAWLAFLPNTCYLLTEWRHFLRTLYTTDLYAQWHVGRSGEAMFTLLGHTLFYACFSGVGMLCFALAIRPVRRAAKECGAPLWFWQAPFFVLLSVGVYVGLVLRLNSWDLVTRPLAVLGALAPVTERPLLTVVILVFAIFLWLAYVALDVWVDGVVARWRRTR